MLLFLSICAAALALVVVLWRWHVYEMKVLAIRKEKYDRMLASTDVKFPITVTMSGESPENFSDLREAEGTLEYFDTDDKDGLVVDALNRPVRLKIVRLWTEVIELKKEAV